MKALELSTQAGSKGLIISIAGGYWLICVHFYKRVFIWLRHPKVNVICHAGTRSVKVETVNFVRVADAHGKTKAINPFCEIAQNQKDGIFPIMLTGGCRLCFYKERCYNGNNHISY